MFIKQLTPEQEALMPTIRNEWMKISLDTSPTDKQKVEASIRLVYECAGMKPPQRIIWFAHPLAALVQIVDNKQLWRRFINYPLWFDFKKELDNKIETLVDATVIEAVKDCLIYPSYREFFAMSTVLGATGNILDEALFNHFGDLYDSAWPCMIELATEDYPNRVNQIDQLALYAYFHSIGIDFSNLNGWWETAKHCGVW